MDRKTPKRPTEPTQLLMGHITKQDIQSVREGIHGAQVYVYGELVREARVIFGRDSNVVVVATWTKRQFGNDRSLLIPNAGALSMVVRNVDKHGCTDLKFWAQLPHDGLPKPGDLTHEDLFG